MVSRYRESTRLDAASVQPVAATGCDQLTSARYQTAAPLGWDGVGAIAILLVAAAALRIWVAHLSVGPFLLRVLWALIYLAAAARLVQRCGAEWLSWTIRHQPALCILLALAAASSFWSLAPLLTLQKAASLLGTTMLGLYIAAVCPPERLMRVLHWTFAVLIVSGIAVAVLVAPPGAEGVKAGWSGVMAHPNSFGAAAAIAAIFFLVAALTRRVHWFSGSVLCALSVFAMLQSGSRTAWIAFAVDLVALVCLMPRWNARRPTQALLRRVSLGLVALVSIGPLLIGPLASALGNDGLLNGRAALWTGALQILRERPLTGYGYAVVWGRHDATLLPHIPMTAQRSASSAHNSIVHVATELGLPAALIASVYLFGALSNAARLFTAAPSAFSLFALEFVLGFTVMSFTEAHLLQIHWMFWVLFVAVTVAVQRALSTRGAEGVVGDVSNASPRTVRFDIGAPLPAMPTAAAQLSSGLPDASSTAAARRMPHVTVCVCTYKRPQLLARLLTALAAQETNGFTWSIVVADNDHLESGQPVVTEFAAAAGAAVRYCVEPRRNIALARNRAVQNAVGDFIAIIDDDEEPAPDWLLRLIEAIERFGADGILGPVLPRFSTAPPDWLLRGRFFDRPSPPTGTWLRWKETRTGNVLLRSGMFAEPHNRFRAEYGSGGEDVDFFRRMMANGMRFAWCAEARVYEHVPADRCTRAYVLKRALRHGRAPYNQEPWPIAVSLVALPVYTLALPLLLVVGQPIFMRYLIKECEHLGRILARLGWMNEPATP